MLQKYDLERDETQLKIDLERDEAFRKFLAAMWGVKLEDDPGKVNKPTPQNGQKQTMTREDIMRNYAR